VPDPLTDPEPGPALIFGPGRGLTIGLGLAAVVALALIPLVALPGRLLVIVVAVAVVAEAVRVAAVRRVLVADESGLHVHTGVRSHHYPWADVVGVEARTARRLVSVATLEIDLDERLVVIPAYRLGVDPAEVALTLSKMRPVGD
jgi:Bacterial PH domain